MKKQKSDFDTPWKEILDIYFKDFIAYCWPEKYQEINWKKGYKILDKELRKVIRNASIGNRIIDKLIEVYLENGQPSLILIHIEIQANPNVCFGERMLIYRYRIRDSYQKPIASLAILIDKDEKWRPTSFKEEFWGSSLEIKFNVIKLLDFKMRKEELEDSQNPFAQVILAQLATLERQTPEGKLITKVHLTRRLYNKGWSKDAILNLYRFIDWIMVLPPQLEVKYQEAIDQIEEELHVAYITTAERIGIQRGIEQGMQQGESILSLNQLKHKFKVIPESYYQQVIQANAQTLLKWGVRVLDCQTLEEVFKD